MTHFNRCSLKNIIEKRDAYIALRRRRDEMRAEIDETAQRIELLRKLIELERSGIVGQKC